MMRWGALVALGLSLPASAAPRFMTLAAGDCDSSDLRSGARLFSDAMLSRNPNEVLDPDAASQRVKPRAVKSLEEIQRQIASAQTHFYNLQYAKANQQVEEALKEIERLPPTRERWSLSVGARMLRGMVMLAAKQNREADDAFRSILALEPNHQLDLDYYSPSTRAAFDKVRQGISSEKRGTLIVRSNPPGADVYLDGLAVGRTPLTAKFPTGRYQVMVSRNGLASFPQSVNLAETSSVHVDLGFEGSIRGGIPLCIQESGVRNDRVSTSVKLGALLGVEEVAVVRLRQQAPGASWLTATLISVSGGHEVREGGLKLEMSGPASQVNDLVTYVTTGKPSPGVVVADQKNAPWANAADVGRPPSRDPGAGSGTTLVDRPSEGSGPRGSWLPSSSRAKAWVPAAGGGAFLVGGIVFYALARGTEAALLSRDAGITDVDAAVSSGKTFERLGWGLGTVGILGVAAAGVMFLADTPPETASVALMPTGEGAAASLSVRF